MTHRAPAGASRSATLSIIIPSYNATATIIETVESALAQEIMATEVIVIDDGSTDDTRDALDRAGLLGAVRYERQENQGVSVARNRGLDLARGKYVCFLDSDDLLHPRYAVEMVGLLRRRQYRIGYCNYWYFTNDPGRPEAGIRYPTYEGWVQGKIISENFLPVGTVLIERSALGQLRFDPLRRGAEDWWLWIQLLMLYPICFHPERLVEIRFVPNSLGRRKRAMISETMKMLETAEPLVAGAGSALTSRERARYFYRLASTLLEGGRRGAAVRRWAQAARHGLDARLHCLFLGKLVLEAVGARRAVELALWNQRTKETEKH